MEAAGGIQQDLDLAILSGTFAHQIEIADALAVADDDIAHLRKPGIGAAWPGTDRRFGTADLRWPGCRSVWASACCASSRRACPPPASVVQEKNISERSRPAASTPSFSLTDEEAGRDGEGEAQARMEERAATDEALARRIVDRHAVDGREIALLVRFPRRGRQRQAAAIAAVRSNGAGWVDAALGRSPISGASPMICASSALCRRSRSIREATARRDSRP
jgi:hypothetical protein